MDVRVTYSYRLNKIMREKGYSTRRLAEEAKVDRAGIRRLRSGQALPSWAVACRIADTLGVKLSEFVGRRRRRVTEDDAPPGASSEEASHEKTEEELASER